MFMCIYNVCVYTYTFIYLYVYIQCMCIHTHTHTHTYIYIHMKVLVAQSCPTPWNPMHSSPPVSSVHGILQARILEWVVIPLIQEIFPTQRLNLCPPHCLLSEPPVKPYVFVCLCVCVCVVFDKHGDYIQFISHWKFPSRFACY